MNPRRLLIAALLLVGLSAALYLSNNRDPKDSKPASPDDAPKILDIPQDQITRLELRRLGADPVVLEKPAAEWLIKAPVALPADQMVVSSLISTLSVLPSDRLVDEKATDFKPYGLASPILTLIVTRKDGKATTVLIGDDTPAGTSTYVRVEGEPKLYTFVNANKALFDKTWRDLRDKRLLPFDSDKLTRVQLGDIEFGKTNANLWTILKPQPLRADNFAAEELVRKLKDAKLQVVNDTEAEAAIPAKFAAAKPVGIAKVTDQKGTMQIEVRKGAENDYYAKSSAVPGIFQTTPELGEALAKKAEDFRNKKLFDFGFNQPERVEVKAEGTAYVFNKTGADWKRDSKLVNPGAVQQLLDRLRELSATGFTNSVAGAVVAEYQVGNEKVTVTKQGDKVYARRANEPDGFLLDPKVPAEIKELAAAVKEHNPAAPPAAKK